MFKKYFLFIIITCSCITDKTKEGDLYYKNKKYIDAITSYDASLKLDPNNVKSIYRRGRSYEELGIYDKALEDYLKVIEIDKTFTSAYLSIAIYHHRNSNYIMSESFSKKALKLNNDLFLAHYWLGRSYHNQGNFIEALKSYNRSISLKNSYPENYHYKGLIYLKLNDSRNACKNFSISQSLNFNESINVLKKYCR